MSEEQQDTQPTFTWGMLVIPVVVTLLVAGLGWCSRPQRPQAGIERPEPPEDEIEPRVAPTSTPVDPQRVLQNRVDRTLSKAKNFAYRDDHNRARETFDEVIALLDDVESPQQRLINVKTVALAIVQVTPKLDNPGEMLERLLSVAEAMPNAENQARALTLIGGAYASLDDDAQLQAVLERVPSLIAIIPNSQQQTELAKEYVKMIGALAENDRQLAKTLLDEIATIVETLPKRHSQVQMLSEIAEAYLQLGDRELGLALLDRATLIAQKLEDRDTQHGFAIILATSYAKTGESQKAADLLGYILLSGKVTATQQDSQLLLPFPMFTTPHAPGPVNYPLIMRIVRNGTKEQRVLLPFITTPHDMRSLTLPYIIAATPEDNPNSPEILTRLLPIALKITHPLKQTAALQTIAASFIRLNEPTKAANVLEDAIAAALSLPELRWKVGALQRIAETVATLKDSDHATPVLEHIFFIANQIPDEKMQLQLREAVADAYFKLDRDDRAMAILEMQPSRPSAQPRH